MLFEGTGRMRIALRTGTHSPWISRRLGALGHEVLVANPRKLRLVAESDAKHDRPNAQLLPRLPHLGPGFSPHSDAVDPGAERSHPRTSRLPLTSVGAPAHTADAIGRPRAASRHDRWLRCGGPGGGDGFLWRTDSAAASGVRMPTIRFTKRRIPQNVPRSQSECPTDWVPSHRCK